MLEFLGALINFFVKLLAGLLCALFILAVVLVLGSITVDRMLLSPDLYLAALEKEHVYERLPGLVAEQLYMQMHYTGAEGTNPLANAGPELQACAAEALGAAAVQEIAGGTRPPTAAEQALLKPCLGEGDGPPSYFSALTIDQWSSILALLLPPDWVRTTTESTLNQLFDLAKTPGAPLHVNVPLVEFKARLTGEPGLAAAMQLIDALPPCAAGAFPSVTESGMPDCRPSQEQMDLIKPFMAAALAQAAAGLPDQVDLLEPFQKAGVLTFDQYGLPVGPRELLQFARQLVVFSPLICLALLGAIALLAVRSWKSLLNWWGVPILLSGAAVAVMALAMWLGLGGLLSLGRESLPASVSLSAFDALSGVAVYVSNRVFLAFGAEGLVVGALGAVLVAVSVALAVRERRAARRPMPVDTRDGRPGLFG